MKGLIWDADGVSVQHPRFYADRFFRKMEEIIECVDIDPINSASTSVRPHAETLFVKKEAMDAARAQTGFTVNAIAEVDEEKA